jgi:lipopolysaccharide transport system permease protein/teichoic acid transport system permease protein
MLTRLDTVFLLARMDFKKRYLGAYIGAAWAVLSPLISIALIYFVITYGLKAGVTGTGQSFADWLIPGMLAWFFVSDCLVSGAGVIIEYSYLVTKMKFPVWVLIPAKILSGLPVHILLLGVFLLFLVFRGGSPNLYWLQLPYFLGCSCALACAVNVVSSAANVFVRDVGNIVSVITQILFWATPLFWFPELLEGSSLQFLLYSPFNYIVSGYRYSILGLPAWDYPLEALIFWSTVLSLALLGAAFFRRVRPHFADVL